MRTTLELDDRVLAAARAHARARKVSLGQAVSELALRGIDQESVVRPAGGFPVLPRVAGHVITDEMVEEALDDV